MPLLRSGSISVAKSFVLADSGTPPLDPARFVSTEAIHSAWCFSRRLDSRYARLQTICCSHPSDHPQTACHKESLGDASGLTIPRLSSRRSRSCSLRVSTRAMRLSWLRSAVWRSVRRSLSPRSSILPGRPAHLFLRAACLTVQSTRALAMPMMLKSTFSTWHTPFACRGRSSSTQALRISAAGVCSNSTRHGARA